MSRNVKMVLAILAVAAWIAVMGLVAYEVGSLLAKSFVGASNPNLTVQKWQIPYKSLVMSMAGVAALLAAAWCALSEWVFSVNVPFGVGKRTIWIIIGIVVVAAACIMPYVYAAMRNNLVMSPVIPVLFIIIFGGAGYWLSTIFATSEAYKYTPLCSSKIRRHKGGRN